MLAEARAHWLAALAIVLAVMVSAVVAFVTSSQGTKMYTAQSRLVVTVRLGVAGTGLDLMTAPIIGQSYAESRPPVLCSWT